MLLWLPSDPPTPPEARNYLSAREQQEILYRVVQKLSRPMPQAESSKVELSARNLD